MLILTDVANCRTRSDDVVLVASGFQIWNDVVDETCQVITTSGSFTPY